MKQIALEMALKIMLCVTSICFVLGRPSIPSEQKNSKLPPPTVKSHLREVKIPPYMMHLYQTLTGKNRDLPRPENQILEESDTVQSFPAKQCTVNNNHWTLAFDLSTISRAEELRLAELRVHLPSFKKSNNVTLEIYNTKNGQSRLFLGSFITNIPVKQHSSWKIFNVTKMMEQYLQRGNKLAIQANGNTHLIQITGKEAEPSHLEYVDHVHKTTSDQATIVFYTKDKSFHKNRSPSLIHKLSVDSAKMDGLRRHKRTKIHEVQTTQTTPSTTNSSPTKQLNSLCRKVDMMVDFNVIGWDNWVVYPKKYNAYQCVGTCHASLNETSKITNHDYIKSFVKDSEKQECPSCVPLEMRPLSMIFYENKGLVLRHYEEMIIEDCGLKEEDND